MTKIINFSEKDPADYPLLTHLAQRDEVDAIVMGRDFLQKKKKMYRLDGTYRVPTSVAFYSQTHVFPQMYANIGCSISTMRIKDFFTHLPHFDKRDFRKLARSLTGGFFYHAQFKFNRFSQRIRRTRFDVNTDAYYRTILSRGEEAVLLHLDAGITFEEGSGPHAEQLEHPLEEVLRLIQIPDEEKYFKFSRRHYGSFFGGNHYFEFQRPMVGNDLYITFHTAGDAVLSSLDKQSELYAVCTRDPLQALELSNPHAALYRDVVRLFINYSRGYMLTTMAMVEDYFRGQGYDFSCSVVALDMHDTLNTEEIDGKRYAVFRQGMVSAQRPGRHILSGYYDTCSYLWKPGPKVEDALYSIDHGMKAYLQEHPSEPDMSKADVHLTRFKKSVGWWPYQHIKTVPLLYSGRTFMDSLEADGLVEVTNQLVPLYNLKAVF